MANVTVPSYRNNSGKVTTGEGNFDKITNRTSERFLSRGFANGVANQKVQLILANTYWGELEVTLTGTYSNQNMAGVITKKYGTGLNANGVYTNTSRVTESLGVTADNFHLGDPIWNATLAKWVIVISHRVSTGNTLGVRVRAFAEAASDGTDQDSFYLSDVYTTDSTVYGEQTRKPAFRAAGNGSWQALSGNAQVPFNVVVVNTGGNYSASNKRFTAPVTGDYYFAWHTYNDSGYSNAIVPRVNGSALTGGGGDALVAFNASGVTGNLTISASVVLTLAKADYVDLACRSGHSSRIYMPHSQFSGFLIG